MAKKSSKSSGGPHKNHGAKRHLFREFKPMIRPFEKSGLLSKYCNEESWQLACSARGHKKPTHAEWLAFSALPSKQAQDEWLANLRK